MTERLPIQVLVYLIHQTDRSEELTQQKVLLLKRSPERGGFWQGVTGGVHKGETPVEAANREVFEETGLANANVVAVNFQYNYPIPPEFSSLYDQPYQEITEIVFLIQLREAFDPVLCTEHTDWQWAPIEEAVSMLKWQQNKDALDFCGNFLEADHHE